MSRIDKTFKELKKNRKKAFIAYITAGDPSLSMTPRIITALENAGADIVELGIPFSDPVADGPTIQAASQRSLAKGASLKNIFRMVKSFRKNSGLPIIFMTYYNPVLQYGVEKFFKSCKDSGVDGVIVPDLPVEEAKPLMRFGRKSKVSTIFLAAPTSTKKRLLGIASNSSGFIYYVSLTGVTGARKRLPVELKTKVKLIKSLTDKPVAVGFGISGPSQARDIARVSDGVIVGSAIVKIIGEKKNMIPRISRFAASLAKAIHEA